MKRPTIRHRGCAIMVLGIGHRKRRSLQHPRQDPGRVPHRATPAKRPHTGTATTARSGDRNDEPVTGEKAHRRRMPEADAGPANHGARGASAKPSRRRPIKVVEANPAFCGSLTEECGHEQP